MNDDVFSDLAKINDILNDIESEIDGTNQEGVEQNINPEDTVAPVEEPTSESTFEDLTMSVEEPSIDIVIDLI